VIGAQVAFETKKNKNTNLHVGASKMLETVPFAQLTHLENAPDAASVKF
jgi:hypothetical protein